MKTHHIVSIPGDGIGKEVVPAGEQVLQALAAIDGHFTFTFESFGCGGDWYRVHGEMMPAAGLHALCAKDAILGIAPTANLDPEHRYSSMFEPIHGSAFDIMGKGLANPIGTFWSCVMLLDHPGETVAAARLMQAIETETATPALHTGDLGGQATTAQVTQAVCGLL